MNGHFEKGRWIDDRSELETIFEQPDIISNGVYIQLPSGKYMTLKNVLRRIEQLESKVFPEYLKEQL